MQAKFGHCDVVNEVLKGARSIAERVAAQEAKQQETENLLANISALQASLEASRTPSSRTESQYSSSDGDEAQSLDLEGSLDSQGMSIENLTQEIQGREAILNTLDETSSLYADIHNEVLHFRNQRAHAMRREADAARKFKNNNFLKTMRGIEKLPASHDVDPGPNACVARSGQGVDPSKDQRAVAPALPDAGAHAHFNRLIECAKGDTSTRTSSRRTETMFERPIRLPPQPVPVMSEPCSSTNEHESHRTVSDNLGEGARSSIEMPQSPETDDGQEPDLTTSENSRFKRSSSLLKRNAPSSPSPSGRSARLNGLKRRVSDVQDSEDPATPDVK